MDELRAILLTAKEAGGWAAWALTSTAFVIRLWRHGLTRDERIFNLLDKQSEILKELEYIKRKG